MPLVVHLDPLGLVLVRKTCRLCVVCEMLIADEAELNRLIDTVATDGAGGQPYVVLGTLAAKTWREGMSGRVTIQQLKEHMADFKVYMRVDITPRHWARRD
jgi:hypothetical protein